MAMDVSTWQAPAVGILSAIVTGCFAHLHYRRQRSRDGVSEAQDTVSRGYVADVARERDEALLLARANFEKFVSEQRRADLLQIEVHANTREISALRRQVDRLTKVLIAARPDAEDFLSGFSALDENVSPPRTRGR